MDRDEHLQRLLAPGSSALSFTASEMAQLIRVYRRDYLQNVKLWDILWVVIAMFALSYFFGGSGFFIWAVAVVAILGLWIFRAVARQTSFNRLAIDQRFARIQAFYALDARRTERSRIQRTIWAATLALLFVIAFVTVPAQEMHEQAIRTEVTREIDTMPAKSISEVMSWWLARSVDSYAQDKVNLSYIDAFNLRYDNYYVFSLVRDTHTNKIVSLGIFHRVFILPVTH